MCYYIHDNFSVWHIWEKELLDFLRKSSKPENMYVKVLHVFRFCMEQILKRKSLGVDFQGTNLVLCQILTRVQDGT